ncbi:hypothetical protein QA584_11545 [Anaerocolumna sp. AGMB13025]|uniref:hypothetical protein n=1 Tax=Anaerocolumna sp. AGMB13025 TaxID=3039116 RepID=UPI00241F1790|nr:hypothetical protein [Anaerocolumna sp. AGMB13025]WFR59688.1 hypothetical protein QA584_11545 [Anaerocolumna sp. AGMB13025]
MAVIINISESKYGVIKGIASADFYEDGKIKECSVIERNVLTTSYGKLIPQYENEGVRNKYINSLAFYKDGSLKKIALQGQCQIKTDIGVLSAELLTFYESGRIKRLFPLNGKITGYWTEENEFELAKPQELSFPFGKINKRLISILFYETGRIKSLTLWPKEVVMVNTPSGKLGVHYGLSLYPEGNLRSCEPAYPVLIETRIGKLTAYDMNANGINGDKNSLNFYDDGTIKSLITSTDSIEITKKSGEILKFEPGLRPSLLDEEGMDIISLKVEFYEDKVRINENDNSVFSLKDITFRIINKPLKIFNKCSNCSECNGCTV